MSGRSLMFHFVRFAVLSVFAVGVALLTVAGSA